MPTDCYNINCKDKCLRGNDKAPSGNLPPRDCSNINGPPNGCAKMNLYNLGRIRDDRCYNTARTFQSYSICDYNTTAYKDCACGGQNVIDIAVAEPTLQFRDGYGWTSVDGCNVDVDSSLRNAHNLTNMRYIQQLYTPPYKTVPYMGRGPLADAALEIILQSGEDTSQKKQCNTLSGVYIDRFVPLVPCLEQNIQNPVHLVEEVASRDWIRGGIPSRDIVRNTDYLKKCGYKYNGKLWTRPDGKKPCQILS